MVNRPRTVSARIAALALILTLALSSSAILTQPARAAVPRPDAARAALDWLRTQQQPDGGFAAFGGASDPSVTADVAFAFASAGIDPRSVQISSGNDIVDYLLHVPSDQVDNPGRAAKVVLALHAASANPHDADADLFAIIEAGYQSDNGWYGDSFFGHLFVVLALQTQGIPIPQEAIDAVLMSQTPEGSWGYNGDTAPGTGDSNSTALAIQALVAVGQGATQIDAGLAYLMSLQDEDGAIAYDGFAAPNLDGDANSTALAIQAFVAAGRDPSALAGGDALTALVSFQNPTGAFQFQPAYPEDSLLATAQTVPALMLVAYPIPPVALDSPVVDAAKPAAPIVGCDFHEPTQHNVCGEFSGYWHANGGLAIFGYALTEEFDWFGMRVQYFERARFEYHPELAGTPYEVLLTRIGADEVVRDHSDRLAPAAPMADCAFHAPTGHNVCGAIDEYWNTYGGLAVFGYALTEPFIEGDTTVQYFERGRFEYRPGSWPEKLDVLLGRLGADQVARELAR